MRVEHCDASGGPTEMRSKHLVFVEPDFAGFLFYLPAFLQLDCKGKKNIKVQMHMYDYLFIIVSYMRGLAPSAFAGWRVCCPFSAVFVRVCMCVIVTAQA